MRGATLQWKPASQSGMTFAKFPPVSRQVVAISIVTWETCCSLNTLGEMENPIQKLVNVKGAGFIGDQYYQLKTLCKR